MGPAGDHIHFYEINPDVIRIANTWFSFLKDSQAHIETSWETRGCNFGTRMTFPHDFDAIVVDAFSSDSIPLHLLTAECVEYVYLARLKQGGVLLLHITNKTLNLEPVAQGIARHLGWQAKQIISQRDSDTGESASQWVAIAADALARFTQNPGWTPLASPALIWTDDFASLWQVLKF